ncbi:MAG: SGNH/GDSL hydrolase family protein [Planctomycetota bacterium]|jgi:lysophospholipase L1-like esterase
MSYNLQGAKRWLFPAVAAFLAMVLLLLTAEAGLRVYHGFKVRRERTTLPPVEERALVPVDDPERIWTLNPGWTDGTFQVNSLGMADDETTFEKPQDVLRIAFVGDSLTCNFGHCPRPEIYLEVLERRLTEASGDTSALRVEALNLGVNGYGALQVARTAETFAMRFDPDMIIAQFCLNDPYASNTAYGRVPQGSPSRLYNFISRRIAPARFWASAYVEYRHDEQGLRNIEEALQRVAALKDRGVQVAGLLFPYRNVQAYDAWGFDRYHRAWSERAETAGLPWLDLREPFEEAGLLTEAWPIDPIHPDPAGHAVAAAALEQFLKERGWLSPETSGRSPACSGSGHDG